LSKRNESPETACRPFDVSRDGTVLGEGAGFLVLESEASARRREARILGEILGYGYSSDAHHVTQPDIQGQLKAMQMALSDAGARAEDIGYVHAHGTGTALNDEVEARAIKTIFGEARPMVAASKSATGHTLAASGVINAIICLSVMNSGCAPRTLNLEHPIPDYDLDYVMGTNRRADAALSMCNSFSFGGSNAVLVLGRRMGNG
jgi:3-oxoacyl-(acyl-carrier-protein) synthase